MFPNRLKELRVNKHLSQKQLAEILNISQQAVGKWETGIATPYPNTLTQLSEIFDVSVDYLVGKTDIKKPVEMNYPKEMQKLISESEDISPEGLEEIRKYAQLVKIKEQVDRNNESDISLGRAKSG